MDRYLRLFRLIVFSLALAFAALAFFSPGSAAAPAPAAIAKSAAYDMLATTTGEWYPVVHVVDGDTIDVQKGKRVRVRFIGVDTPEVVDPRKPVQCFGEEASQETHALLDGKNVRLETDPSQGTYDIYGRLLAYVFLSDGTSIDEYLIAQGYGHEYTFRVPYKYQKEFKAAEAAAREAGRGLWAPGACANP